MRPPGRATACAAALAAACLLAPGAARADQRDRVDAFDPIDLRGASLVQRGDAVTWTIRLREPLTAQTLAPSAARRVCLVVTPRAVASPSSRVCLVGTADAGGRLGLRLARLSPTGQVTSAQALEGSVSGTGTTTVRTRFETAALELTVPRFGWRVTAFDPTLEGCAPPGQEGCGDLLPDTGVVHAVVVPPRLVGCVARGTSRVSRLPGTQNTVALTFDDGPTAYTSEALRILEREHVRGTFFEVGRLVAARAGLLRRMLEDGDAIGNHTWSHANMAAGGRPQEITRTQRAIRDATGYTPCVFRPPYGATSRALVGELHGMGLTSVLWDVDPRDWSTPGQDAITGRVQHETRRGSIVLLHDGGGPRSQTLAALPRIIASFKARGYRFVTIPEGLAFAPVYGPPARE